MQHIDPDPKVSITTALRTNLYTRLPPFYRSIVRSSYRRATSFVFRAGIPWRLHPISGSCGAERGKVIDRYYIENFLEKYADDVKGHVLEMANDDYTRRFGGPKVVKSDILDVSKDNLRATIVTDLTTADDIPSNLFDCAIVTQTLQMIFDIQAAVKHLHRILKPGGVLLVTSAGTSKVWRFEDVDPWGEYWRLTGQSAQRLFSDRFGRENVKVETYGNILTSIGFLHGLSQEELTRRELDHYDPRYEVIVAVRAVKAQ